VKTPRISICIPAYRAERHLAATLASVRAQSFDDWELIVVEDGSRDSTESLVNAFAATVPQPVRYLRHEQNRKLPATRNTAHAAAVAPCLALLDADDLWTPDHLATSLALLGDPTLPAATFAACEIFDDATDATLGHRTLAPKDYDHIAEALHSGRLIAQPSGVLITRAALNRAGGFDEIFPICNDIDFWIRLARAGVPFRFTGRETLRYRKHPDAMSRRSADLIAELARVHFKHRDWAAISVTARRTRLRRLFLSAARMNARSRPARALHELFTALVFPCFIR
jgi:glycosyltransferase involved in cell wall biosynthesis